MTVKTDDLPDVALSDIEFFAEDLNLEKAAVVYKELGCLVVRGLMKDHLADMRHADWTFWTKNVCVGLSPPNAFLIGRNRFSAKNNEEQNWSF